MAASSQAKAVHHAKLALADPIQIAEVSQVKLVADFASCDCVTCENNANICLSLKMDKQTCGNIYWENSQTMSAIHNVIF